VIEQAFGFAIHNDLKEYLTNETDEGILFLSLTITVALDIINKRKPEYQGLR
jgi:hypothetical protein